MNLVPGFGEPLDAAYGRLDPNGTRMIEKKEFRTTGIVIQEQESW